MKKIISLVMAMLIILSMGVFADDVMLISEEGAAVEEAVMPNYLTAYGEIKESGEGYIVVNTADGEIQFNYSDEFTFLIDAGTVEYFNIAERKTDMVMVAYSMAMTRSIPPQAAAYAIIGNIESEMGNPIYTEVEDVKKTDDGIVIITENGNKEITVLAEAEVAPFRTRNIVRLEDVVKGSKVLLWYDMMTMSIPAYATSEKVVVLAQPEAPIEEGLFVNGVKIELKDGEEVYINGDVEMLPLRTVAETLGCTVSWDDATMGVKVEKGDVVSSFVVTEEGSLTRTVDTVNAILRGDKTYVPANFFDIFA